MGDCHVINVEGQSITWIELWSGTWWWIYHYHDWSYLLWISIKIDETILVSTQTLICLTI
jgi:hypothetical protein